MRVKSLAFLFQPSNLTALTLIFEIMKDAFIAEVNKKEDAKDVEGLVEMKNGELSERERAYVTLAVNRIIAKKS